MYDHIVRSFRLSIHPSRGGRRSQEALRSLESNRQGTDVRWDQGKEDPGVLGMWEEEAGGLSDAGPRLSSGAVCPRVHRMIGREVPKSTATPYFGTLVLDVLTVSSVL